jgi:diguanylate cyclase (GGDEF)-like protein
VLLPDTSIEDANEIAERLRKNVEDQRILHADGALPRIVTVSIGVSCCAPPPPAARLNKTQDEPILYPAMLLNAADRALYRAKRNGRNLVEREFCGQTHATVTPLLSNASNNHAVIHAA